MREHEYSSWFDFVKMVEGGLKRDSEDVHYPSYYRGQPDATWQLKTTLERYTGLNLAVGTYCKMIEDIQPAIESFTNKKWDLTERQDFLESLKHSPTWSSDASNYFQYMSYLRHFGFPSPLLDWTQSPFIAAYFAFRDITSDAKSVAIYSKMEAWEQSQPNEARAEVYPIYANSRNNTRHYLQQSIYTICIKVVDENMIFSSYEDPDLIADDGSAYISKIVFPASERANALLSLDAHNINAYSLFGSEESLLETMFVRKYISAQRKIKYFINQSATDLW